MKLFQKDKIIITTYENYLLIYDIINLELLLENKLYSKPEMLGIYEHNKFFIQEKEISFFEFIGSSSSEIKNKYFLNKVGKITIENDYIKDIVIQGEKIIIYKSEKETENMAFNIYNLHNFQYITKVIITIIKEPHSEIIPKLFVQRSKKLGLFEAKDKKLTFATFKKNYELNKRTILKDPSFLVESFNILKFKELKDQKDPKNDKFMVYYLGSSSSYFSYFHLYLTKNCQLLKIIKVKIWYNFITENGNFVHKGDDKNILSILDESPLYINKISIESGISTNNIKYLSKGPGKFIVLEKPQKIFIYESGFGRIEFYVPYNYEYYILLDVINFIICFFYMCYIHDLVYDKCGFIFLFIPFLLRIKLIWKEIHFIIINIEIILAIFNKISLGKALGLIILIAFIYLVLFTCYTCTKYPYRV